MICVTPPARSAAPPSIAVRPASELVIEFSLVMVGSFGCRWSCSTMLLAGWALVVGRPTRTCPSRVASVVRRLDDLGATFVGRRLVRRGRNLGACAHVTLATADADGVPWATPVWYAPESYTRLVWISRP